MGAPLWWLAILSNTELTYFDLILWKCFTVLGLPSYCLVFYLVFWYGCTALVTEFYLVLSYINVLAGHFEYYLIDLV